MIFYFSGTGNSKYVASKIAIQTKETLVCITKEELEKNVEYELKKGEKLGFVFPIYWWGIPVLVEEFVQKMKIQVTDKNYVFAVCTYGLESHNGLMDLKKLLWNKKISLQATFEVKMVDNYVIAYDIAGKEKQEIIYKQAESKIEKIICDVMEHKKTRVVDVIGTTVKPVIHHFYKCTDHRKNFYVTEECTGCGYCARNCPCQAIIMEDNKPVWKENCSFCLKCLHSCPTQALQNGKGTLKRSRYLCTKNECSDKE